MIQVGVLVLATIAVLRFVGKIDFRAVGHDVADANWAWVALALLVAQLPRVTQAIGARGSIAADVRFGPLYMLQLATSYLNLAVPAGLARMSVILRFFQLQGLPAAGALTASALDSLAGNVMQVAVVIVLVIFSSAHVLPELAAPTGNQRTLLWIVVGLVLAGVLATVVVGRLRRPLVARVREWWPHVKESLGVLRNPRRLPLLLGGNLGTEIVFASALGVMARAFGAHVPLSELILINSGTSFVSSFVPVPGGIGVVELSLEVGLTSAGMTASAAATTILLYRMSVFYLPPLWGFAALRWLERKRYL